MHSLLAAATCSVILASCDNPVEPPHANESCTEVLDGTCWTFLGPDDRLITAMEDTPWGLFVGTRRDFLGDRTGVHRLDTTTGTWQFLGLDHAINSTMLMVPGDTARLLVGMIPFAEEQTDAAVYATEDGGETWTEWDAGLARQHGRRAWAFSLAMDPGNPNRLFMGQGIAILRSENGGRTWNFVFGEPDWGGSGMGPILVSPKRKGRIWAAWQTSTPFNAGIRRSDDWGENWEHLQHDNPISELIAHPDNPDRLWSGELGRIQRSEDGGSTWTTVFVLPNPGSVNGLLLAEGRLFAASWEVEAGNDETEYQLGLYRSLDSGDSWESLAVPNDARAAIARSLILGNDGALLIGTLSGVWRITR